MADLTIPGVLFKREAAERTVPLVIDSPHSGTVYSDDFRHAAPMSELRKAEGTYVDELYEAAPDFGATLIGALFPRSYIDPNRSVRDMDVDKIDGDWPDPLLPGEKTYLGAGLIWSRYPPGLALYDRRLSADEVRQRIDGYWWPYNETLRGSLDAAHDRFGRVWHLNCHSMPEFSNAMSKEGAGSRRPEFCLGDRSGTFCDLEFTDLVRHTLLEAGHEVTVNDPYTGVELVKAHADPAAGRHSLQVEIRRDLYMDEDTFERNPGFETLKSTLAKLVSVVADHVRSKLSC